MEFNDSEFPDDVDLKNASTITDIDDADQVPCLYEWLVLDMALEDDYAPGKRREQLLRLVKKHYICPVYGSPVSLDISAMMGVCTDDVSLLGEELEVSD